MTFENLSTFADRTSYLVLMSGNYLYGFLTSWTVLNSGNQGGIGAWV
jgi:hypothetical protein